MSDDTPRNDDKPDAPLWCSFTVDGIVYDPNTWRIERGGNVAAILTADGKLIDEPTDVGQSDGALIRHGILWTIANAACADWSIADILAHDPS